MSTALRLRFGASSHVGHVREHQEDAYLVMNELDLAVVADGMGGHLSGDVASALAIGTVGEHFGATSTRKGGLGGFLKRFGSGGWDPGVRLADAIRKANETILTTAGTRADFKGMGTTIVGVWLMNGRYWYAHVGDSRLYLCRDGVLRQLTEDHSLLNEYLRLGVVQPEHAAKFPYKNIIVRAVGLSPGVEVDTASHDARAGDRLLLCSDGLTDLLDDDRIRDALAGGDNPTRTADRLVEAALAAGGLDNVTAVVAHARAGDEAT